MSETLIYRVGEVQPYINWIYFFHAWGFQPRYAAAAHVHDCDACRRAWVTSFPADERGKALEALKLHREALHVLRRLEEDDLPVKSLFRLCRANADGDDLILESVRFPLLRQQTPHADGSPYLCLSDFVRPLSSGTSDTVGLFASTVCEPVSQPSDDPYRHLLVQTLCDRLAEAATEKMHLYVRKTAWGYAPDEDLSVADLLANRFQGIRPAVGYPSLPDQSVNFLIDRLLDMKQIGISLTENGAMHPHASVCGLMLAHPAACYFSVGSIDEEQLQDYARRRGLSADTLRKFLGKNR